MKRCMLQALRTIFIGTSITCCWTGSTLSANGSVNQTPTTTPVVTGAKLPFKIQIDESPVALPDGLQSYVYGVHDGKWLILAGRTNGLHNFSSGNDNFPVNNQNSILFVVDMKKKSIWMRSLYDEFSGLTLQQQDELSVTNAQRLQRGKTLYIIGGYGVESATGQFSTKPTLTAIDIEKAIEWVINKDDAKTLFSRAIRQYRNPALRVTGGSACEGKDKTVLLVFGQDFKGYYLPSSNGEYTKQVRRFRIHDNGKKVKCTFLDPSPLEPLPEYRRRDLNVVPIVGKGKKHLYRKYVVYSGVFTPQGGVWTVPVKISMNGIPSMSDPSLPETFKQGMNNYSCANIGLFSKHSADMYTVLFGGISYGYFNNGSFQTDPEVPFINQVTAIKRDQKGQFTQYLLDTTYPTILSTGANEGNPLLFGAEAEFIPARNIPLYCNGVMKLDRLKKGKSYLLGYIVGGIQSTLPNTNVAADSQASDYIFEVRIIRE